MCLAVPMRIVEIGAGGVGVAEVEGTRYDVDLGLIGGAVEGDFVIVHAGYAIEKLDRAEADERLALFAEMARLERGAPGDGAGGGGA
jgi:hydrogenase expression/formation protein HypC